jgi:hypothetical protein
MLGRDHTDVAIQGIVQVGHRICTAGHHFIRWNPFLEALLDKLTERPRSRDVKIVSLLVVWSYMDLHGFIWI